MKLPTYLFIVLILGCIAATYQLIYEAPELSKDNPHSDALIYQEMAQFEGIFEKTHITYRPVVPVVAGAINKVINPKDTDFILHGIFAFLNVIFFTLGMYLFWNLTFFHRKSDIGLIEVIPLLFVFSLPFFWRGAFLPLIDTAAFALVAAMLWAHNQRNPSLLFLLAIIAIFTKEITILTILFFPLIDMARNRYWPVGYLSFIPALLIHGGTVLLLTENLGSYYLASPSQWIQDWHLTLGSLQWWDLRYLLSGLGAFLVLDLLLIVGKPKNSWVIAGFISVFALFIVLWLFTPSNSPRLIFMTVPLQYLFIRGLFS